MNIDSNSTSPSNIFEIGQFLLSRGEFEDSILYLERALRLAEPLQNLDLTWNILKSLAIASEDSGFFINAIFYLQEVIAIDRERHDLRSETKHLIKMGEVYIQSGDLEKGAKLAQDALSILRMGIEPELSEKNQLELYFSKFMEILYHKLISDNAPRFLSCIPNK
jgi:tetratricopeptide (TPR) repeat protein